MTMNSTTTVGCDLGDRYSHLCVLKPDSGAAETHRISTTRAGFAKFFGERPKCKVVIEVGAHSRWVSELLVELKHQVVVANARQLPLIYRGRAKDDITDAEKLARLGRFDERLLSPIQHRSQAAQADLAVIRARDSLVRSRTALINAARGMMKSAGHRVPKCTSSAFAVRARKVLPEMLCAALVPLLDAIEGLNEQIKVYDKTIEQTAEVSYPETKVLRQVAGVGALTALAFILTLEDPKRFRRSRTVPAFLGLCPRRQQSGDNERQCGISKAGDGDVRRLLVQSAQYILGPFGPDTDLRSWGLRLADRGGKNAKKRAVVAVARKLAVLLHRLWKTGDCYEPLRQTQSKAAA